jgi:adenylate cyclase
VKFATRRLTQVWETEAPADMVWDALAYTDKLNRAVGLPPVQLNPADTPVLESQVSARLAGVVPMHWIEYPFEWVRGRSYSVQRDYTRGPLAPVVGRRTMERTRAYCQRVLQVYRTAQGPSPGLPASSRAQTGTLDRVVLGQRLGRLQQAASLDARLVERLAAYLGEAGDDDLVRMQPYALADRWGADRYEALRVFLHATRAGVLNLLWELMCPNCRVPKGETGTLAQVTRQFHCDTCGIDYAASLDRYVELRFRVHPAIRAVHDVVHCFGGPYSAPHILVQHLLRPGELRAVTVPLQREAYRVRTLLVNRSLTLAPAEGPECPGVGAVELSYAEDGWRGSETRFAPGPVEVRWANRSSQPIAAVLERVRWDDSAVTAAEVAALQEFRDLFGSEVLAPGQEIGVESVTVLFSDLRESTRLYELAGDAPAYGQVRRHFEFLKERIASARGAVVKTIGDAVMAVFQSPADALGCGLAIQRDIHAFNEALPSERALVVKLGLHHGPAIAITANARLDYFGRTVNLAARILRESQGGDVVILKGTLDDRRVREVLEREKASVVAEWSPTLRGLAEPLTLCRVRPA